MESVSLHREADIKPTKYDSLLKTQHIVWFKHYKNIFPYRLLSNNPNGFSLAEFKNDFCNPDCKTPHIRNKDFCVGRKQIFFSSQKLLSPSKFPYLNKRKR